MGLRVVAACSSYWHSQAEFDARYAGAWLAEFDPLTGNRAITLHPDYNGRFGLRNWHAEMQRLFTPVHTVIACGSWSDPAFAATAMPTVTVLNGGVPPDRPHSNGWQYFGCAFTALTAWLCNRRDWDVCCFLEPDILLGAIDWNSLLTEFVTRPEEVAACMWCERHCDIIALKPAGAARFLHQRLRPNLSTDEALMWIDDEIPAIFKDRAWNPWPFVKGIRQDFFHALSGHPPNAEVMTWPMIRQCDPAIIAEYTRTQSSQAKPLQP